MSHAIEARRLLRACRSGSLATLSKRLDGYPFASIVPFMVDHDARPVVLISRLAEHTKNIEADERTSLMVHEPGADVQASARLTIAGKCRRIDATAGTAQRYLRLFPTASRLLGLDFDFYRLTPVAIRYIGGFGSIRWVPAESFAGPGEALDQIEEAWLRRIGDERLIDPRGCCRRFHGFEPREASAVALDCDGIDLRADGTLVRIAFSTPVSDAATLAEALGELRRECEN